MPDPPSEEELKERILRDLLKKQQAEKKRIEASAQRETPPPPVQAPRMPPITPSLSRMRIPREWVDEAPGWAVLLASLSILAAFILNQAWLFLAFLAFTLLLTFKALTLEAISFLILLTLYAFTLTNPSLISTFLTASLVLTPLVLITRRPSRTATAFLLGGLLITLFTGQFLSLFQPLLPARLVSLAKTFLLFPAVLWGFVLANHDETRHGEFIIPKLVTASLFLSLVIAVLISMLGTPSFLTGFRDLTSSAVSVAPSMPDVQASRETLAQRVFSLFSGTALQDWVGSLILTATGQQEEQPDTTVYGTRIGIPPAVLYPARIRLHGFLKPGDPLPLVLEGEVRPNIPAEAIRAICSDTDVFKGVCDRTARFTAAYADDPNPIRITPEEETLRTLFYSQTYPISLFPSVPAHLGTHTVEVNITYPFVTTTYAAFILADVNRADMAQLNHVRQTQLRGKEIISFGGPLIITTSKPGIIMLSDEETVELPFIITLQPSSTILSRLESLRIRLPEGMSIARANEYSLCTFTPEGKPAQTEREQGGSCAGECALPPAILDRVNARLPSSEPVRLACTLRVTPDKARALLDPATGFSVQSITLLSSYEVTSQAHTQLIVEGMLDVQTPGGRGGRTSYAAVDPSIITQCTASTRYACLVLSDEEKQALESSGKAAFLSWVEGFVAKHDAQLVPAAREVAEAAWTACLPHHLNPAYPIAIIYAETGWSKQSSGAAKSFACNNPFNIKYHAYSFPLPAGVRGDGDQEDCKREALDGGGFAAYDSLGEATAHLCAILSHYAARGQVTPYLMNEGGELKYANGAHAWTVNVQEALASWEKPFASILKTAQQREEQT